MEPHSGSNLSDNAVVLLVALHSVSKVHNGDKPGFSLVAHCLCRGGTRARGDKTSLELVTFSQSYPIQLSPQLTNSMAFSLSIGDIVLLGSLAWKIGRAFTSGRAGAPAEFREVENELTSLSLSIKKLTDTLRTDDSILAKSNDKTRADLERTLAVCNEASLYHIINSLFVLLC